MAVIQPVHGESIFRLAKAIGIPPGTERFVIECDVKFPIRIYVRGFLQVDQFDKLAEFFEYIPVDEVTVDDDTTVHFVEKSR